MLVDTDRGTTTPIKMKKRQLLSAKTSLLTGFLFMLVRDPSFLALSGVHADHNHSAWKDNRATFVYPEKRAAPLHSFSWTENEETEGGGVSTLPPVAEFQQADPQHGYQDSDDGISYTQEGEVQQLSNKTLQGRRSAQKRRRLPPHRLGRGSHSVLSSVGLLSKQAAGTSRPRRYKFLVAAVAALVALLLLGQRLSGRFRRHLPLRGYHKVNLSESKNSDDSDTEVAGVTSSDSELKMTRGRKLPLFQLVFITICFLALLAVFAKSAGTLLWWKGSAQGREQQERPGENYHENDAVSSQWGEILLDDVPRRRLVKLRALSGRDIGEHLQPPVDYQRRSSGNLHIVVGRAWKLFPGRPWVDTDSYIRFKYGGHSVHAYLPEDVLQLLKNTGRLKRFLEVLSLPSSGVALFPDGVTEKEPGRTEGVPINRGATIYGDGHLFKQKLEQVLQVPPSLDSIFDRHSREAFQMRSVLRAVAGVLADIEQQGPRFSPPLMKMDEHKAEV